jgi:glycosyltransferase involved in cell wall biosynthesis
MRIYAQEEIVLSGKLKVAVIVPALNEEKRIGAVLEVLKQSDILDELIVVNDGSSDATSEAARSYTGVRVIDLDNNEGKGTAMQVGLDATDADIVTFIDADLVGITPDHIGSLIKPLLENDELMMTVGVFKGGRLSTDIAQAIVPVISGQRAVKRGFFRDFGKMNGMGFGVEIAITKHAKHKGYKVKEVPLHEASQVMKEEKMGLVPGIRTRVRMYSDIAKQLITKPDK